MENLLKKQVRDLEISGIRKINQLANKYDNVIRFTLGEPDFNTPIEIKEATKKAIDENKTKYSSIVGIEALRQNIVRHYNLKYNFTYNKDEVILTFGAAEALGIAISSIIDKDDEVIVPAPAYPAYKGLVELNGGKIKYIYSSKDNFDINISELEGTITNKTKCIILTNPNNPTGKVLSTDLLNKIINIVKNNNIFLILDAIYEDIIYTDQYIESIKQLKKIKNKLIYISGYSKSFSMTGWRMGYLFADNKIIKHLSKYHHYFTSSNNTFIQHGLIDAFNIDISNMIKAFEERRDYVYRRLKEIGFDVYLPKGAFYFFPSIKKFKLDSETFCINLLDKYQVACIPGGCFSESYDDHIRISYATSLENLKEGLNRIEDFIKSLK